MKINITAKVNAKVAHIKKIDDTHFTVAVKEPARQGKANGVIQKALAKYFGRGVVFPGLDVA